MRFCLVCGLSNAIPVGWYDPASGIRCDDETMCHCPDNLLENINMKKAAKDYIRQGKVQYHDEGSPVRMKTKPKKATTKAEYEAFMKKVEKLEGVKAPDWAEVVKGCVLDLCEGLEKAAIALGDRQKQGLAYAAETIALSVQLAITSMRQASKEDMEELVRRIKETGEKVAP